jgi:hypothetical protein
MSADAPDPLERALASRRVMLPPAAFTAEVLRQVQTGRPLRPGEPTFLTEYGVQTGLTLAAAGLFQALGPGRVASAIDAVFRAPEAPPAAAIVIMVLGWILTKREPEAEAL